SPPCRTTRSLQMLRTAPRLAMLLSPSSSIATLASTAERTARRRSHPSFCSSTRSSTTRRSLLGTHSTLRVFTTPSTSFSSPSSSSSLSSLPNSCLESNNR
ncbi:hypothetical protein PMAYCL1PPCAC_08827, partial [Pristionchus mayeri]